MSTIQTIQLGGSFPPPPPPVQTIKTENLLSDEDIDKLIEQQREKQEEPKMANSYENQPKDDDLNNPGKSSNEQEEDSQALDFDLDKMNTNLLEITKNTKQRIKDLCILQQKIKDRISLLDKFIKLDEKDLAVEVSKPNPNDQRVRGIRNSITNQTELYGNTMDILLKFESSIQSWTKTLMDVEKDKVSAYQKIKSVNKDQTNSQNDINDVLGNLNAILRSNPEKISQIAENTLTINGYGGKKFIQS